MDVGATNGWRMDDVVPAAEIVAPLDAAFPLEPAEPHYRGEVAKRWRYRDGKGEIGIIASVTQPFCGDCTRSRISAEGKLYTCLFAVRGHDLRALIRGGASDAELARAARRDLARPRRPLLGAPLAGDRRRPAQGRDELHRRLSRRPARRRASRTGRRPGSVPAVSRITACRRWLQLGGGVLPRGWADLGRQMAIWFGFALAYQLARAATDRNPARAFANGDRVVNLELHVTSRLYELTLEQFVDQRHWLAQLVSWTYWNSEFTVVGLALLWVYIAATRSSSRFRNSILLANVLGLCRLRLHADGAAAAARARLRQQPPRRPDHARREPLRGDAEPARLRLADRRASCSARATRHWWAKAFWLVWPAWVWFAVVATGNHFWLDCIAGMVVALLSMRDRLRAGAAARLRSPPPAARAAAASTT